VIARRILFAAVVIVALLFLSDTALTGQTTGVFRANAQGEIVLDKPAIVGNTVLPAGTYSVHSHGSGAKQQVHFMQEVTLTTVHPESSSVIVYDEAGRVTCDVKERANAAEVTALHFVEENGTLRIVSADIKGEAHTHVF
jgi:hypothetical protein